VNKPKLEKEIGKLLKKLNLSLAVAESCTGGYLSHRITNVPDSSKYFKGGIIAYSNQCKIKVLEIPKETIKAHSPVSKEVACLMATNVRSSSKADIGVSITGIAGPESISKSLPVGSVYIGLALKDKTIGYKFCFKGNRLQIKKKATEQALRLLKRFLEKIDMTAGTRGKDQDAHIHSY
jgi:nicotinamide-nucleotide amidase